MDFPITDKLVYLDSGATSLTPTPVIEALAGYYRDYCANIHRGIYSISEEATSRYEEARQKVATFIGAEPEECIFTSGTTDSINLLASAWGEEHIGPGDTILLSGMEHHSNLVPWQQLAQRKGAKLAWVEVLPDGTLDLSNLDQLLAARPKLLALTWVSNVFGTINPVAELAARAREAGALVVIDGAQGVPHLATDVSALDCDFLAFSGHKMLGPTGIGVLYGRRRLLEALPPYRLGGGMILQVKRERTRFGEVPQRFEAGTPHIAGAIGLGAAIDYLSEFGMDRVRAHEQMLLEYAFTTLGKLDGMRLLGPADTARQSGVLSFDYRGIHPHDLATLLDREQVCIRAGHHCCQPLMRQLGMAGTTRASFYIYNTTADVDRLAVALGKASEVFTGVH
ncbi:MAG: SufS family cysteine desulfurase [Candidatus Eremiobacteraeota bacterium]|nr:SufS family cysteine desulfurase [Candidatus Eremiobacteraeota bacterium]